MAPSGAGLLSICCCMQHQSQLLYRCSWLTSPRLVSGDPCSLLKIMLNQAELEASRSPGVIDSHQRIPQRALNVCVNRTQ